MPTIPASIPPRQETTHQVNYVRKTVNFNDANIATGVMFEAIPLNSYIKDVEVEIVTGFNAGTTNVLTFGTTLASANELVNAGDLDETAVAVTNVTRGKGRSLTQTATIAQSGVVTAQGGIGLFAKYTQTGTAATAGKAIVTITFIPDNDG